MTFKKNLLTLAMTVPILIGLAGCDDSTSSDGTGVQSSSQSSSQLSTEPMSDASTAAPAFTAMAASGPLFTDSSAHWLDLKQLAIAPVAKATTYELRGFDSSSSITQTKLKYKLTQGGSINTELYPHLSGFTPLTVAITENDAKALLKNDPFVVALDSQGNILQSTRVQIPFVIDALYTRGQNDADETQLGARIENGAADFRVWAPTAKVVKLHLYDEANKTPLAGSPFLMKEDPTTGIWRYTGNVNLENKYYRYEVQVYHPKTDLVETLMTTDPYSVSLSTGSVYSQLVDLNNLKNMPNGWAQQTIPSLAKPEDLILYETHIRDFSGSDKTGTPALNGKYGAFAEPNRASVKHLLSLRDAGLNTIHLLPSFDISSVPEVASRRVDLDDPLSKLCDKSVGVKPTAKLCSQPFASNTTIKAILESKNPATGDVQDLLTDLNEVDGFNWGYDPLHYTTPEGSYALNSEGTARIKEYREMIKTLHGYGFRVVQDVVYNHTSASGLYDNSVLDKVVPGYYHRLNPYTGNVENSTCCDNTASEHRMFEKLMIDSLLIWANDYKIDGFRFDLMGHLMKSSVEKALVEVQKVDPDTYFYGEGWDFGEVGGNQRGINASQGNMAGTGMGSYNDRIRDAVRGRVDDVMNINAVGLSNAFDRDWVDMDKVTLGMAGTLQDVVIPLKSGGSAIGKTIGGYTLDPQESINYVSKHDNQTIWDLIQYKAPSYVSAQDRAKMQALAFSTVLYAQGIPFLHMGDELLRSKSMERDSYDSGDWFNRVDFSGQKNNWNVGLPRASKDQANWNTIKSIISNPNTATTPALMAWANERFKEQLRIRSGSDLFRLENQREIMNRLRFYSTGNNARLNTVVFSIDDGVSSGRDIDPNYDAILVGINASNTAQTVYVPDLAGYELHPVLAISNYAEARAYVMQGNDLTIPALSSLVFVKKQHGAQSLGADTNIITQPLYLRGSFNAWGESSAVTYSGNQLYEASVNLTAGNNYSFKFASSDWRSWVFGYANFAGQGMQNGSLTWLGDNDGNVQFTATETGQYRFILNIQDLARPALVILPPSTKNWSMPAFGATDIYLRGTLTDWNSTKDKLVYLGDGRYQASVDLQPGTYYFKLASADWSKVVLRYSDLVASPDGLALQNAYNDNQVKINVTQAGTWQFTLDTRNRDQYTLDIRLK